MERQAAGNRQKKKKENQENPGHETWHRCGKKAAEALSTLAYYHANKR